MSLALAGHVRADEQDSDTRPPASVQLDRVEVLGTQQTDVEEARQQLRSTPGASNFVDLQSVERGRLSTNENAFKYQPGVYAKTSTNEGSKISIRGSGLNRGAGAHASGLYEQFDGLP